MRKIVSLPLKEAFVFLLLKKPLLELTVLDNFHPVSFLLFWGNVIDKVVAQQLQRAR